MIFKKIIFLITCLLLQTHNATALFITKPKPTEVISTCLAINIMYEILTTKKIFKLPLRVLFRCGECMIGGVFLMFARYNYDLFKQKDDILFKDIWLCATAIAYLTIQNWDQIAALPQGKSIKGKEAFIKTFLPLILIYKSNRPPALLRAIIGTI
jgi:hypothetical protein